MAAQYTYSDFESAASAAGMLGRFSQYDLNLARQYPEFGLSLLSYKKDYANAATDEAKYAANTAAEYLRKSYGNYTAGAAGNAYYAQPLSPAGYRGENSAEISGLLNNVTSRGAFSYNPDTDPDYAAYRKQYLREGARAVADTLGQASAATGGIPSTAAVTAANQAGDYYAGQLSDMVPELSQQAYNRYLNERNLDLSALSALQTQDNAEYSRLLDQTNYNASMAQQKVENAFNLWTINGVATQEVADILGVPVGTPTSDQAYNKWYQLYAEGK